jgi:hypothetical protein
MYAWATERYRWNEELQKLDYVGMSDTKVRIFLDGEEIHNGEVNKEGARVAEGVQRPPGEREETRGE